MKELAQKVLDSGHWFLVRFDDNYKDHLNKIWNPIGEWTDDVNCKINKIYDGVFSRFLDRHSFLGNIAFCEIDPNSCEVNLEEDNIVTVSRARIILWNELPDGLFYPVRSLNLSSSNIKTIPENLFVEYNLDLRKTLVERLPESIKIGWGLILSKSKIKELPKGLKLNYLDLYKTEIKKLPDDLEMNGNLDLSSSLIEELPENFTVKGYLDLRDTYLKSIPEGLHVHTDLILSKDNPLELPKSLRVDRKIIYTDRIM